MQAEWTKTAVALPPDGTLVEFLLDERISPMRGVFAIGRFESRWNDYPPPSVSHWRAVPAAAGPVRAQDALPPQHLHAARRGTVETSGFGALALGAA